MPERRMMIIPAELVRKVDENRGDLSQAEFIEFLLDSHLADKDSDKGKDKDTDKKYATKEEIALLEEDVKNLLKSFLDFFVSYGLELGKQSPKTEFEELSARLHVLEEDLSTEDKSREAKIKWK